jgi:hypothetical protein
LGNKTARDGATYIRLLPERADGSFPLYIENEWLRACPARFTCLSDEALAKTPVKISVSIYSSSVIEHLRKLDAWALEQVAARSEELLGSTIAAECLSKRYSSLLFFKSPYAPTVEVRLFMDQSAKPTGVVFDGEPQKSATQAIRKLRDARLEWKDWQRIPIRVDAEPSQIWISSKGRIGVELKATRVCVRTYELS